MLAAYKRRNAIIVNLGFIDYQDYLKSELWKSIRRHVLDLAEGKCEICGSDANQVHHTKYTVANLSGRRLSSMLAACNRCHTKLEWKDGVKLTPCEGKRLLKRMGKKHLYERDRGILSASI